METQLIDWVGAASAPSTGATYYIGVSGYTVQLVDDVAAADVGTGFNVGTNAIVRYTATSLPANATVNNSTDLTGGASFESDDDYFLCSKGEFECPFMNITVKNVIRTSNPLSLETKDPNARPAAVPKSTNSCPPVDLSVKEAADRR